MPRRVTIEEIEKTLDKTLEKVTEKDGKRIYRKPKERPAPERSAQDEVNRTTKMVGVRIDPQRLAKFNQLSANFPTKRDALEYAIKLLEQSLDDDSEPNP